MRLDEAAERQIPQTNKVMAEIVPVSKMFRHEANEKCTFLLLITAFLSVSS